MLKFRWHILAGALATILAWVLPRASPLSLLLVVFIALDGTRRAGGDWRSMVRVGVLACTAFAYPFFLGGVALPVVAMVLHFGLIVGGWADPIFRRRLVYAQSLAAGLGTSIAAAAAQFFFPFAWRGIAFGAVVAFFLILIATIPRSITNRIPSPHVCVGVLVLSEGLIMLRSLPTHWTVNGAVLALGFAALIEMRRFPRVFFLATLSSVLFVSTWGIQG
jgi:hypothetical protein